MLMIIGSAIFSFIDIFIGILLILKYNKYKKLYILLMSIISFGLFYDAFIVFLSGVLKLSIIETEFFKTVSLFRFIFHGALIPLNIMICEEVLNVNRKKLWYYLIGLLTFILSIVGIYQGALTKLEIFSFKNINRYVSSSETPTYIQIISMIITIFPMIPPIIVGIILMFKRKNPHLFLSAILMFTIAAIGGGIKSLKDYNFFISMIGEIFMVIFYYLYVIKEESNDLMIKSDIGHKHYDI